jgi:hypothetical protein
MTSLTRDAARQDVSDCIETFYRPSRMHTQNDMLSPVKDETR